MGRGGEPSPTSLTIAVYFPCLQVDRHHSVKEGISRQSKGSLGAAADASGQGERHDYYQLEEGSSFSSVSLSLNLLDHYLRDTKSTMVLRSTLASMFSLALMHQPDLPTQPDLHWVLHDKANVPSTYPLQTSLVYRSPHSLGVAGTGLSSLTLFLTFR